VMASDVGVGDTCKIRENNSRLTGLLIQTALWVTQAIDAALLLC